MEEPVATAFGVPCIILAGGLGTRLQSVVPDVPKCLAPVGGRPFLAWQIDSLAARGVSDFILSLGHLAHQIEQAIERLRRPGVQIRCVTDPAPLGTGGALLHVLRTLGLRESLVMNGDTFLDGPIASMRLPLDTARGELALIATVEVADRSRYGSVVVGEDGRVVRFLEKGQSGPGSINAGFYRVHVDAFESAPRDASFSFEATTLTALAARRAVTATRLDSDFIDIGTPADYRRFCHAHRGR